MIRTAPPALTLEGIAFEASPLPMLIYDRDETTLLAANDAALLACGYGRDDLSGLTLDRLVHADGRDAIDSGRRGIVSVACSNGGTVEFILCASVPFSYDGRPARLAIFRDLTAERNGSEALRLLAFVDPATHLPNRTALLDAPHTAEPSTLLLLHVAWEAQYGGRGQDAREHGARTVAIALEPLVPKGSMLVRYGDDVFAVRIPGSRARLAISLAKRLLAAFERPISDGDQVSGIPTIGIAAGGRDPVVQARAAQAALDHAMHTGIAMQLFDDELASAHDRHATIERNLRHAVLDEGVTVLYQPIVSLGYAEVVGAEALLRWDCPDIGPVPPAEFIAIAEESRSILRLGESVLRGASAQNRRWQLAGFLPIRMTVNVTPRQVAQRDFLRLVSTIIETTALEPEHLELELKETAMLSHDDASRRTIEAVRRLGVRIAIDEFGSGYSSLSDLGSLPVDTLKLDRSLVAKLGEDPFKMEVTRAVVGLAHGRGIRVVGVGVERSDQVAALIAMECDEAQGFLLGTPAGADEITARLERDRLRAAVGTPAWGA